VCCYFLLRGLCRMCWETEHLVDRSASYIGYVVEMKKHLCLLSNIFVIGFSLLLSIVLLTDQRLIPIVVLDKVLHQSTNYVIWEPFSPIVIPITFPIVFSIVFFEKRCRQLNTSPHYHWGLLILLNHRASSSFFLQAHPWNNIDPRRFLLWTKLSCTISHNTFVEPTVLLKL